MLSKVDKALEVVQLFGRIGRFIVSSSGPKMVACTRSPSELWLTHSDTTLLLCLMVTCLSLPQQYLEPFQSYNFSTILDDVPVKAEAILLYLNSVLDQKGALKKHQRPEKMCIRRCQTQPITNKQLEESELKLIQASIAEDTTSIE
jgi:hypothetical protein